MDQNERKIKEIRVRLIGAVSALSVATFHTNERGERARFLDQAREAIEYLCSTLPSSNDNPATAALRRVYAQCYEVVMEARFSKEEVFDPIKVYEAAKVLKNIYDAFCYVSENGENKNG